MKRIADLEKIANDESNSIVARNKARNEVFFLNDCATSFDSALANES